MNKFSKFNVKKSTMISRAQSHLREEQNEVCICFRLQWDQIYSILLHENTTSRHSKQFMCIQYSFSMSSERQY